MHLDNVHFKIIDVLLSVLLRWKKNILRCRNHKFVLILKKPVCT